MARSPKKAVGRKGARKKKRKIEDLPAGRKAQKVKGGSFSWSPTQQIVPIDPTQQIEAITPASPGGLSFGTL